MTRMYNYEASLENGLALLAGVGRCRPRQPRRLVAERKKTKE